MSLTYVIKSYETDTEDSSKTRVGFYVTDAQGNKLAIDKLVTTGSKSKQTIVTEASNAAQDEINDWASQFEVVGKTWNPDTNSIEN
ncbi:hypothetical protein [uncultured Mediterranean phage uvMED]|nr:hypothetical protein [uncultured Mediterranean phage uvMED]